MFRLNEGRFQGAIGGTGFKDLGDAITKVLPLLFGLAGILLLIYLILGGFGIMTSRGDPKALEAARAKITYAIVGFILIFAAFWLVQILGITTGVGKIGETFK